jgi:2-keto-4-pentenoate hydratase
MPLTKDEISKIADMLYEAELKRIPIDPITDMYPSITIDDAYKIQLVNVEKKVSKGERVIGRKIGLTSKAMQKLFNVYEPDYGHLTNTMYVCDGGSISLSSLIQPKVEAEIAFILKEDLRGPGLTVVDVLRATEGVVPALEIIDSRIRNWRIKIQDTIADNGGAARFVLGSKITKLEDLDLRLVGMVFEVNDEVVATAAGASVMGNPVLAVLWLANKLLQYGTYLRAGEVILSGSLISAVDVKPGDFVRATFDRLGTVSVRFTP